MEKRATSGTIITLILMCVLTLALSIQPVKAGGTIYIRPNGSVEGTDKIEQDGDLYTFTGNIYEEIVVEKDNIIIDGNGYELQGSGTGNGFFLSGRTNVTVENVGIIQFSTGIQLIFSSLNTIAETTVSSNTHGINLYESATNTVSNNTVTSNQGGIVVYQGSNYTTIENNIVDSNGFGMDLGKANWCTITRNNITNNMCGIWVGQSSDNTVSGNNMTSNNYGMVLSSSSSNSMYHNSYVDNTLQIYTLDSMNVWDNGYPSGGNYWSDYSINYPTVGDKYQGENQDVPGSDGVWDHLYEVDASNLDNYPLIEPWTRVERKAGVEVGDWVKYGNFDVAWSSNDPDSEMPVGIAILSETEWLENSVEDILGSKIKYQQLLHLKDGSEYSTTCWIDVDTGSGTALTFISSGLVPDGCIYASAPWYAWKLNETTSRQYIGVPREVNCLNITTSMQFGPPPVYPNSTGRFFWDEETGVLCELSMKHLNQTGSYVTSWSAFYEIVDTNLWEAPSPDEETQELIEIIEAWGLPKGTENSLTSKLEGALHLLDKGNENGAQHKLMDFMNQVEALRGRKLPEDKADYLISEAQRVADLING